MEYELAYYKIPHKITAGNYQLSNLQLSIIQVMALTMHTMPPAPYRYMNRQASMGWFKKQTLVLYNHTKKSLLWAYNLKYMKMVCKFHADDPSHEISVQIMTDSGIKAPYRMPHYQVNLPISNCNLRMQQT